MILTNEKGEKHVVFKLGEIEDHILVDMATVALEHTDWNVTKAAMILGICRTTLAMRIKKWGLTRTPIVQPSGGGE